MAEEKPKNSQDEAEKDQQDSGQGLDATPPIGEIGKFEANKPPKKTGKPASTESNTVKSSSRSKMFTWFGDGWESLKKLDSNRVIAVATVVIAISTIFQFGAALAQWIIMSRQLNDFESSQRASLTFDPLEADWPLGPMPQNIAIKCTILNVGLTSATSVDVSFGGGGGTAEGRVTQHHGGIRFDIPFTGLPDTPNPVSVGPTIGPNKTRDCSWNVPLDANGVSELRGGKVFSVFWVSVSYKDVFGKSYLANDCLIYQPWEQSFEHCTVKKKEKPN
jgi:hypothetical protein